jgi:hypothetical protein
MYPVFVGAAGSLQTANVRTTSTAFSFLPSAGNLTIGGTMSVNANNNGIAILNGGSNGVGNIGSSSSYFNTVYATATTALYADLAEVYEADADYDPGTVVSFGGTKEVTQSLVSGDVRVAGVISTNPSYTMNNGLTTDHRAVVALTGRVPTRVTGSVRKGDQMISNGQGGAMACAQPTLGTVIGKSLCDFDGAEGTIEIVVGRQ